jgi:hypothetical protein
MAYLLNHLYTRYISSQKKENAFNSSGDKYIVDMFTNDSFARQCFEENVKFFLPNLSPELNQQLLNSYPELSSLLDVGIKRTKKEVSDTVGRVNVVEMVSSYPTRNTLSLTHRNTIH